MQLRPSTCTSNSADLSTLKLPKGTVKWQASDQWIGLYRDDYLDLFSVALAASQACQTEAVGVFLQTSVDCFEIRAFSKGEQVRKLVFDRDGRGWTEAEGEVQQWEKDVFFNNQELDNELEN